MSVKQQFDISDEEMKTARICTSPRRFSRVDYILSPPDDVAIGCVELVERQKDDNREGKADGKV